MHWERELNDRRCNRAVWVPRKRRSGGKGQARRGSGQALAIISKGTLSTLPRRGLRELLLQPPKWNVTALSGAAVYASHDPVEQRPFQFTLLASAHRKAWRNTFRATENEIHDTDVASFKLSRPSVFFISNREETGLIGNSLYILQLLFCDKETLPTRQF